MLLAQYIIEAVTIVTVVIICTILAIYLSVLKKNGWLGSLGAKFYRCPNQGCKRIFQKPIELKDLSETPARIYPACPHCGMDLEPLLASGIEKKSGLKAKTSLQQKKMDMKIEDSASKIGTRKPEIAEQVESSGRNSLKTAEAERSQIGIGNRKKLWNDPELEMPTSKTRALKIPQKSYSLLKTLKEVSSNTEVKMSKDFQDCSNFFGYLQSLPKGTVAPPGCHSCPKRVDCNMRVRAIASIYVDQESTNVY